MFYLILALVDPGDEVLYPNPGFPIYESMIRYIGGVPVPVRLLAEKGHQLDVDQLIAKITPRTRLIVLNYPHNPTGGIIPEAGLRAMARAIRQTLGVGTVVVHPRECAACATRDGEWCVPGPYIENPKITTGAGDHFNSGFVTGQLLGLSPEACLTVGVCFSGYYVRTALSPSLNDVDAFLRSW